MVGLILLAARGRSGETADWQKMQPIVPRGYVCQRAASALSIDGKLDKAAWKEAPWSDDFADIEGALKAAPRFRTRMKMLWDDDYLYVAAELSEPHVCATITQKNAVIFNDNDFELFIDPDGDNHNYHEFEMNALNTIWELDLAKPYKDGGKAENGTNLEGLKSAVQVHGTLNDPSDVDTGWTVEIAFPWKSLAKYNPGRATPPRDGDAWRMGFSRVEWRYDIVDGKYVKLPREKNPEDNWVWSPQGIVDMHRPERWGYVQFTSGAPGTVKFRPDPALRARDALMAVYHAQKDYFASHKRWAGSVAELNLNGHAAALKLNASGYEATLEAVLPDGKKVLLHTRQDSLLWAGAEEIVFADFEGDTYGKWQAAGSAFGSGPAQGALPGQMAVEGYLGHGLANSFHGGDDATGRLTSPEFTIAQKYISFLIGGGGFEGKTCLNLLVDGKAVRSASGSNTQAGGSERLELSGWDVGELDGKVARIEIVDEATGGWGHINVDQIVFTDAKPPVARKLKRNATRELVAVERWLNFPVKTGAEKRAVTISVAGKIERRFEIELADGRPDWFAPLDVSAWRGKALTIGVDQVAEDSKALEQVTQSGEMPGADALYKEALRPQFHFSAQRGWLNDPNGLVFANGAYHLFFQHNPYGWEWGNMHWGHATSADLVHWKEEGEALYPDELGPMFSGSAVVDAKNTSGLGRDGAVPLVLIYTAAGNRSVQCIASSLDGHTFTKYSGNPVLQEISGGNRDPKVCWHAPTGKWVMALYVARAAKAGEKKGENTIHFLTSPNLKEWTIAGQIDGFYECPDLFELPVEGDAAQKKWVLTAANSDYMVGAFDGSKFTPESPKLKGQLGRGFYAAQTFDGEPKGRRIQIGWFQAPAPGMPFNQSLTLPLELSLRATPDGPRLARAPVAEVDALRVKEYKAAPGAMAAGEALLFADAAPELLELRAEFDPGSATEIRFLVRGITLVYDAKKQELTVNNVKAPAPLRGGMQRLTLYADRTGVEVFASDGLTYVPLPVLSKGVAPGVKLTVTGGGATVKSVTLYELKSAW